MSDYNNQEVTAEQQINNEEIVENMKIAELERFIKRPIILLN